MNGCGIFLSGTPLSFWLVLMLKRWFSGRFSKFGAWRASTDEPSSGAALGQFNRLAEAIFLWSPFWPMLFACTGQISFFSILFTYTYWPCSSPWTTDEPEPPEKPRSFFLLSKGVGKVVVSPLRLTQLEPRVSTLYESTTELSSPIYEYGWPSRSLLGGLVFTLFPSTLRFFASKSQGIPVLAATEDAHSR